MSEDETAPFPKSDTPARLLVILAAALANGPIVVTTLVFLAGREFRDPTYEAAYGLITLVGLLLLTLLTLILAIVRSPTWRLAGKCLLTTFAVFFVMVMILPLRFD